MNTKTLALFALLASPAFADSKITPTFPSIPAASADATSTASATADSVQSADSTYLAVSPGGASSQFYTGPCVVPKRGGFLKRGIGILFVRADQPVEIDMACVEHLRAMDLLAADQEQQRIDLERERVQLERDRLRVETLRLEAELASDK